MSSGASSDTVLAEERNNAGVITLNRPKALNAINLDMVKQIYKHAQKFEKEKDLTIIKGAGEKSFCAGGDVVAVVQGGAVPSSKNFFRDEYTLNHLIGNYKKPYIAIIDGITMGGGVGLSVHGRYRVATERTMFAMPETAIGLFPDVGGGYFLPRLQGKVGLYLGLTGFRLKGRDVEQCGIATHYCASAQLPELEEALSKCKTNDEVEATLAKHCPKDPSHEFVLAKHLEEINSTFSAASVEDIVKNLKESGSEWAKGTLKYFSKMSPTSMKVTKRQLDLGAHMSLGQALRMEYRMAVHHLEDSDFKEGESDEFDDFVFDCIQQVNLFPGVRALLIDKDQQPKWNPATLEEVLDHRVKFYFNSLEDEDLKLE